MSFAGQARDGCGYEVTRNITLMPGYRYVDLGTTTAPLIGTAGPISVGRFSIDQAAHEIRAGIRIYYFEFDSPWR